MRSQITCEDWKGLWSILWRFLILGPLLLPIGLAFFAAAIALALGPLCFGVYLILSDHFVWGILVCVIWALALRKSRRLFERLLEGIENAAL